MAKRNTKEARQKRDGIHGPIMLIPHVVLNSLAYKTLSGSAKGLLNDLAMQYNTYNNGGLLASWRYMSEQRGWTSNGALAKAKKELIEHCLIVQTVQGLRPNKASWYGLTWYALDQLDGLEISPQVWPRGAYAHWLPPATPSQKRKPPPPETREKYYQEVRLRRKPNIGKNTTSCP